MSRPPTPSRPTLDATLRAAEKARILEEIRHQEGSIPRAAVALAVPRRTLYRRIETLGIRVEAGIDAE